MICAIVLAAGESRRMGSQKLLLSFAQTTVIGHILDQLSASCIDEVFVVLGHDADKVKQEISSRDVVVVENPDYKEGMLSSVRSGLKALPETCQGVMIVLGDQPSITTEIAGKTIKAFKSRKRGIVVPVHDGKRGHPMVFSSAYRNEILSSYDDVGLRGLLRAHADDVFELEVMSRSVLKDMDTPEDYQRELAELGDEPGNDSSD